MVCCAGTLGCAGALNISFSKSIWFLALCSHSRAKYLYLAIKTSYLHVYLVPTRLSIFRKNSQIHVYLSTRLFSTMERFTSSLKVSRQTNKETGNIITHCHIHLSGSKLNTSLQPKKNCHCVVNGNQYFFWLSQPKGKRKII